MLDTSTFEQAKRRYYKVGANSGVRGHYHEESRPAYILAAVSPIKAIASSLELRTAAATALLNVAQLAR